MVAAMIHRGCYTNSLLLRATAATAIRVISPGPISNKGNNNDLPISPTSLAQSGTDPHKYLLTSSQIEAVIMDSLEILDYSWTPSSAFCRVCSVDISILHTPNLGEAMLNSFIVVSDPK
jgi:hypothetical protein